MARLLFPALVLVSALGASLAFAHGNGHKNLKVLADVDHKALDGGMKSFAKGLGVKCSACHVKGEFALDDVPAKKDARAFLRAVVGQQDPAKRKKALDALLRALDKKRAEDEALIWRAVSGWTLKRASK